MSGIRAQPASGVKPTVPNTPESLQGPRLDTGVLTSLLKPPGVVIYRVVGARRPIPRDNCYYRQFSTTVLCSNQ